MNAPSALLPAQRSSAEGAGLVPSKTSLNLSVSLSVEACADRRVKRLKRSVWASGHLHGLAQNGFRAAKCWFVTLTYVGVLDWRPDHISTALQGFRNWCKSKGVPCRYTWVGELQQRGAVHYHLLAWLPVGVTMPHWDKTTRKHGGVRAAFWPYGMSNTEIAKSGVGYLMKYLSKLGELTKFPKGLRLYGIGGLDAGARAVRSWYNLPEWAKCEYGVGALIRAAGGLVVKATGELLEPVFRIDVVRDLAGFTSGVLRFVRLRETAARFHDGAYSTFPRAC